MKKSVLKIIIFKIHLLISICRSYGLKLLTSNPLDLISTHRVMKLSTSIQTAILPILTNLLTI